MGRTSIAMLTIILSILGVCYFLGVIDSVPLDMLTSGWLFALISGQDITPLQHYAVYVWIATIFGALGVTGIITGLFRQNTLDQYVYWSVTLLLLGILLSLTPIFLLLRSIHPMFAFFGIGLFIAISIFIIIDWSRNPLT